MLRPVRKLKQQRTTNRRFAIVASQYNARYVNAMVRAAKAELTRAGAGNPLIIRVPGAYEIPVVAARLARAGSLQVPPPHPDSRALPGHATPPAAPQGSDGGDTKHVSLSAIICLGVILRGETTHAAHIGDTVSRALMQIQLEHEVPVIHEVLLLENHTQARIRCLSRDHNRGTEAAQTALAMARLLFP